MTVELHALARDLAVVALPTPTLPPATHTGCYLVGQQHVWIVDPGTPYPDPQREFAALLDSLEADGRVVAGVFLTHHHIDHISGLTAILAQRQLPVAAHPKTIALLPKALLDRHKGAFRAVDEGDSLDAENDGWHLLHTPGHAPGHLVLWDPVRRWIIGGDMMASIGTIVIAPPDGHMTTYLTQLQRLERLSPARFFPAHGAPIDGPVQRLQYYQRHRLAREAKVLACLSPTGRSLNVITSQAYAELPVAIHALARGSTLAHLIRLQELGQARRDDDDQWSNAVD